MTTHPASGTLGHTQLISFANASCADAVALAAKELGFTQVKIETGDVVKAAAYFAQNASPEILIVEIDNAQEAPGQLDALADVVNPHTKVLATGTVDSIRFYQWLSDLGIEGYLLQPFSAGELKTAIAKGNIKKPETAGANEVKTQKIVAVIGARGGVGTTMIATNLAALFVQEHHITTALVDLDPYFGSVALALDLEPGRGLRDALEKPDRVDGLFLERVMVKPFAGLGILSAEEPLMDTISMQPNAGEMIFAALREKFTCMVVDLPRQMNPVTRYVLMQADHIIIVAEPQITSLRDTLRIKDYVVDQLKRPVPLVVLNKVGVSANNELSAKDFAKNYGHEVSAQFHFLHDIVAATAQGELLSATPKLNTALNPLRSIARGFIGKDAAEEEKEEQESGGGILSRLKGRK